MKTSFRPTPGHFIIPNSALRRKGDDVTFIPGHGPMSTLGEERLHNPFLQDEQPIW